MRITLSSIFLLTLLVNQLSLPQQNMTKTELIAKIESELRTVEGMFAIAVIDCEDEQNSFNINGDSVFHAASTMKTPVMIEAFKKISENKFQLNDSVLLENKFTSIVDGSEFSLSIDDDSGEKFYSALGKNVSIYDLLFEMITVSSNLATNVLIEIVTAKDVMQTMNDLGISGVNVLRGVEDIKAFDLGINNSVTANGLAKMYQLLAERKVISAEASDKMIEILLQQKFKELIPKHLPADVKVAHKTGSITGVEHDSGIVFLPNGKKYVIVFLSKNLKKVNAGRKLGARVSKIIYDHLSR